MLITGQLLACMDTSSETVYSSAHRHAYQARKHALTDFRHASKHVCQRTFQFLHGVGSWRVKALRANLLEFGLTPRVHGNVRRLPHHALTMEATQLVVNFITTYAEEHAILLPGRVPGYKRTDVQLLPTSTTKKAVWLLFQASSGSTCVAYTTFCRLWRQLLPHVLITKPMADLCWVCQKNATAVMRSANKPDADKSQVGALVVTLCGWMCVNGLCVYMYMYVRQVDG